MINWKVRYAKLIEKNPSLLDQSFSVLEVGSGNFGISEFLKRRVIGLEPEFSGTTGKWIDPFKGSILDNDFADSQFDYVICVDVLEHLRQDERNKAIKELLRIAKKKVLLSFPSGEFAKWGDKNYAAQLKAFGLPLPSWLQEHIENGFPTLAEVIGIIKQAGYQFDLIGNEGMMQHYGGILLDHFFGASNQLLGIHSNKTVNQAPIIDSEWDLYYSFLFSIDVGSVRDKRQRTSSLKLKNFPREKTLRLYTVFHESIPLDHFGDISPLAVGDIVATFDNPPFLTDILKDGSRLKNSRWSELSGIFKVWKEVPSGHVGFCHYRRLFDLRFEKIDAERYKCVTLEQFPKEATRVGSSFLSLLDDDSIFLPKPEILDKPIFDQYHFVHKINDLCLTLEILQEHFPELSESIPVIFESSELYANNMFITSWNNFDEICQIWFKVLTIFEGLVVNKTQNRYQLRDISFLAERIFTIWIHYKKSQGKNIVNTPFFHIDYPGLNISDWSTKK